MTVLSVGGGAGVRRAAVGAAAGALATRCWRSGTPWKLERAPAWGPPAVVNCLMASAVRDQSAPPFPLGGEWPVDTRGADRGCCAPRPGGGARGGACALGTRWGRVVLLDGGSSWAAPGRAALLEPPAAASAAAMRCPGNLLELWSKRGPANPRREGALLSRHVTWRAPAHKDILGMVAREPGRPLWSSAARTRAEPRRAPPPSLLTVP
jgi:hypothetical protein